MQPRTRRALVLSNEAAGHPFRRSLPGVALTVAVTPEAERCENRAAENRWRMTGGDWRGFLSAYCASLVVVAAFIA